MNKNIATIFSSVDKYMSKEPRLGISQDYDRSNYEDVSSLTDYKSQAYDGKKTIKDPYSGRLLHRSRKMAMSKYGKGRVTYHISQTDHITPLKSIHNVAKHNPFLRDEDIRLASNRWTNYTEISAHDNMSKQDATNFEVAYDSIKAGEVKKASVATAQGIVSATAISAELTAATISNASEMIAKKGYNTVKDTSRVAHSAVDYSVNSLSNASLYIGMEAVRNLYLISEGKLSVKNAVDDLTKMSLSVIKNDMISSGTRSAMIAVANNIRQNSLKAALKSSASCNIASMVALSVIDTLCSGEKLSIKNIYNNLIESTMGSFSAALQTAAILAPIPGAAEVVGISLMVTSLCAALYTGSQVSQMMLNCKSSVLSSIEVCAIEEITIQKEFIKSLVDDTFSGWDEQIENSYRMIIDGAFNNDADSIANGIDDILYLIGKTVKFKDRKSFDDFFSQDNIVFSI